MDKRPLIDFIAKHSPAAADKLLYIAQHFEEKTLSKNEFLLCENTVSDDYYFIADGFMRAF